MKQQQTIQKPKHIAIIMDGNGRWAKQRGLPRTAGHHQGIEATKRAVKSALELGVEYLTLFGFSSENWSRPAEEINELMRLLRTYLKAETSELHKSGTRLRVIGNISEFDEDIVTLIRQAEALTANNKKLNLTIALNYGGRQEIVHAATKFALHCQKEGITPSEEITKAVFPLFLYTAEIPDPDIMIRTSAEMRISNFLLWQMAYTEFIFTEKLWPDFNKADMEQAISEFASRDRRFGNVSSNKDAKKQ
ncbi:MAG: isoprenyl transferase [Alphaproteobacteria bacterium]|nr:isoprenyl transferase [Alphaproteobacteria bacterium]